MAVAGKTAAIARSEMIRTRFTLWNAFFFFLQRTAHKRCRAVEAQHPGKTRFKSAKLCNPVTADLKSEDEEFLVFFVVGEAVQESDSEGGGFVFLGVTRGNCV